MDCTRNPIGVKRIVGYMPDNVGFYSDMTGRQNLRFTGRLNGLKGKELEERINNLLERVGMTSASTDLRQSRNLCKWQSHCMWENRGSGTTDTKRKSLFSGAKG